MASVGNFWANDISRGRQPEASDLSQPLALSEKPHHFNGFRRLAAGVARAETFAEQRKDLFAKALPG